MMLETALLMANVWFVKMKIALGTADTASFAHVALSVKVADAIKNQSSRIRLVSGLRVDSARFAIMTGPAIQMVTSNCAPRAVFVAEQVRAEVSHNPYPHLLQDAHVGAVKEEIAATHIQIGTLSVRGVLYVDMALLPFPILVLLFGNARGDARAVRGTTAPTWTLAIMLFAEHVLSANAVINP